jgi:DNA-binding beta-propeller fold protein YncE
MPIIQNCLTSRSKIIKLSLLPNGSVIYATQLHGIRAVSLHNCETNLHLNPKNLNENTSAIAFSPDGNYIAIANKKIITIIYIPTRKVTKTIKTDEQEITSITFDAGANYIVTTTKNGRVLQYKFTHSSLLSRIFSLKPPIYAITFYKNLIASSGDDNKILITSLNSLSKRITIQTNGVPITALTFLNQETLISANKDGVIFLDNIKKTKQQIRIDTDLRDITKIIVMNDPRYIIVGGKEEYIIVVDIHKERVIHYNYIVFDSLLQEMALTHDEFLIVALKNNKILKIELPSRKRLHTYIEEERLPEAFFIVEKEPMLQNSIEHKKLEKKYQAIIAKAVQALSNNNKELALQLTNPFKYLSSKSIEIAELFRAFEKFTRFQALFLEKKYALAYAMTRKYPAFEYTTQYKKMEKAWQETFADAQRQMIIGRDDVARGILSHYMTTITKRSLIKFVLNHNKEFLAFLKAIEKRDYKQVYKCIKQNKLFKQVPNFKTMEEKIEEQLKLAKEFIFSSKIEAALDALEDFDAIPHLKEEVISLKLKCEHLQELQQSYQNDDFLNCYNLIDEYKELEDIELTHLLEKHWNKLIKKCEEYALTGNLKKIKFTLKELILIPSRRAKIGDLLRVSYQSKIKMLLTKKGFNKAKAVIYTYLDIFGLDREIGVLKQHYEKLSGLSLAIEDEETLHRGRDAWIDSEFIVSSKYLIKKH